MKKFNLIVLLLLLLVGCSKISGDTKNSKEESSIITLKFQEKKLLIRNDTKNAITILDSETEFSVKKNGKWESLDETHGLTVFTTTILSGDETELDLTQELSKIDEKEVKVTIHYEYQNENREKSILYVKEE